MGFWKFSPFLVLSILALYQVGILQAAPFRPASENSLEPPILTENEVCLLLTAVLNDYVRLKVRELQREQETDSSSITAQESPCDTTPCVTKNLEGLLARAERMVKNTFVAASVDPEAFGHRHKELGA
ncbi:calcitonin receptor-stimulating peptide 2-like [Enhydra lutris kenyoni]|uniref:Calcitonin receptor-stimulating peptide 2-like n=1 Tax=Enhydra lutris kenyoni TaxID=391180 RepID=A0A2Y9IJA9_ENHLU|nr:calcitonin receptor-stimulating peptide 2-like [Enhydra lutris kenyoni]